MKKLLIIITLLIIAVIFAGIFTLYSASPMSKYNEIVYFEIKQGEGANSIARKLELQGLIRNAKLFSLISKYLKYDRKLLSGYYQLNKTMNMIDIMKYINSGKQVMSKLTITEGKNIYEIANYLEEENFTTKEEFLKLCHDKEILQKYNIPAESVEGYIFPSTYYIVKGNPPKVLINLMIDSLFEKFPRDDFENRAKKLGYSLHEVLTMASIIEKEMGALDDPKIISSVYYNRLSIDMRLQADPTTIYAMTLQKGDAIETVKSRDIAEAIREMQSPYNTYLKKGLPPAPICSSGVRAIEAALNPARTDYLFFVADGTGKHVFTTTYEEHVNNINKYIFNRR